MTSDFVRRQEFVSGMDALRFEIKADIAQLEARLIKWMVSLMVGAVVISSTIASTIVVVAEAFFG